MKNLIIIILVLFSTIGCKKDLDSENISKVTYFADLKMSGDGIQSYLVGTPYTDAGVKAYENNVEIPVVITGTVDVNTPGAYVLIYTATNKDGYSSSLNRIIGIYTSDILDDDFTGSYQRTAGAQGIAKWTKVMNGVYLDSDVGGANANASVYVFNIKKDIVVVPPQPLSGAGTDNNTHVENPDGTIEIQFSAGPIGTTCYKWVVFNPTYGPATRSFVRVN